MMKTFLNNSLQIGKEMPMEEVIAKVINKRQEVTMQLQECAERGLNDKKVCKLKGKIEAYQEIIALMEGVDE